MELKTEFSIGDKVFYIRDNKIESFIIGSVSVVKKDYVDRNDPGQKEMYSRDIYGRDGFYESSLLFKDIDSLLENAKESYIKQQKE